MRRDRLPAAPSGMRRLLWFVLIWAASVTALAVVAALFRGLMHLIGLRS